MRIALNPFARDRHTPASGRSHFRGTEIGLTGLVHEQFHLGQETKPGVMSVPCPAKFFMSGVIEVEPMTNLAARFIQRRKGEAGYVEAVVRGQGCVVPAAVEVILYSHDLLAKDGDASTDADWEIISINARITKQPEPMPPLAMARNFLGAPGGTKQDYSAEEFAKAIWYWSNKVMAEDGFKHVRIRRSNLEEVTRRLNEEGIANRMIELHDGRHDNGDPMCKIGVTMSGAQFHKLIEDLALTAFDKTAR